jgi:hypothetical protein
VELRRPVCVELLGDLAERLPPVVPIGGLDIGQSLAKLLAVIYLRPVAEKSLRSFASRDWTFLIEWVDAPRRGVSGATTERTASSPAEFFPASTMAGDSQSSARLSERVCKTLVVRKMSAVGLNGDALLIYIRLRQLQ